MKTKQTILVLFIFFTGTKFLSAQEVESVAKSSHRIIFQMVSGDTLAHKQLMKQLGNIRKVSPETQMEVVCHGPGLDMLVTGKTTVGEKLKENADAGIKFYACEFSMEERKVERSKIINSAGTVPAGIIEIVTKQEQGWSYIKSGF